MKRSLLYIYYGLLLSLLAGCATMRDVPDDQALRERAQVYWDMRLAGDIRSTYEFETPEQRDGWLTPMIYQRTTKGAEQIQKLSIREVTIEGDLGTVVLDEEVLNPYFGRVVPFVYRDPWVKIEGTWYHLMREPGGRSTQKVGP